MASSERLPDEALVVRCGRPPFDDPVPLDRALRAPSMGSTASRCRRR